MILLIPIEKYFKINEHCSKFVTIISERPYEGEFSWRTSNDQVLSPNNNKKQFFCREHITHFFLFTCQIKLYESEMRKKK